MEPNHIDNLMIRAYLFSKLPLLMVLKITTIYAGDVVISRFHPFSQCMNTTQKHLSSTSLVVCEICLYIKLSSHFQFQVQFQSALLNFFWKQWRSFSYFGSSPFEYITLFRISNLWNTKISFCNCINKHTIIMYLFSIAWRCWFVTSIVRFAALD